MQYYFGSDYWSILEGLFFSPLLKSHRTNKPVTINQKKYFWILSRVLSVSIVKGKRNQNAVNFCFNEMVAAFCDKTLSLQGSSWCQGGIGLIVSARLATPRTWFHVRTDSAGTSTPNGSGKPRLHFNMCTTLQGAVCLQLPFIHRFV